MKDFGLTKEELLRMQNIYEKHLRIERDKVIEKYGIKLLDVNIDDLVREIDIRAIICSGAELAGKSLTEENIDDLVKRIVDEYHNAGL